MLSALRVLWAWVSSSACSLRHSSRRPISGPYPLGTSAASFLSAGEGPQPRIPWQVLRRFETPLSTQTTAVWGAGFRPGESPAVSPTLTKIASAGLGSLCQTRVRRPDAGAPLSRPIHASGRHLQSQAPGIYGEHVTFRWKDYVHRGKQRKMTLLATEFLRRFFLHVLPKGFVRIRHFGFLSNRFRASQLALCRQFLAMGDSKPEFSYVGQNPFTWHCPHCGAAMVVQQRFTGAELARCSYFDSS